MTRKRDKNATLFMTRRTAKELGAPLAALAEAAGVTVTSTGRANTQGDYLVCCTASMPSPFRDNLPGRCSRCGIAIYFRPHVPPRPKKICIDCAEKMGVAMPKLEDKLDDKWPT